MLFHRVTPFFVFVFFFCCFFLFCAFLFLASLFLGMFCLTKITHFIFSTFNDLFKGAEGHRFFQAFSVTFASFEFRSQFPSLLKRYTTHPI